jgi:hypothetical protein
MVSDHRPEPAGRQKGYRYRQQQRTVVAATIEDAFDFLADPATLPLLDPPWVDMRLMPGPSRGCGVDSEREYLFRWSGILVYLLMRVAACERPHRLVLEQVLGPWQSFRQTFALRPRPEGTEIADDTEIRAMPGVVDHVIHRLVVARQVRAIEAFRRAMLGRYLGAPGTSPLPG